MRTISPPKRELLNPPASKLEKHLQIEDVLEEAPEPRAIARMRRGVRIAKINWEERDAANRRLGTSGEQFVAELERRHLIKIGRPDLADKVETLPETVGDGAGYDVLSFTDDGEKKYIEVKTTAGGKMRAFLITSNELRASKQHGSKFWLYRVYGGRDMRRLYRVSGPLSKVLSLEPTTFRAMCRAGNSRN